MSTTLGLITLKQPSYIYSKHCRRKLNHEREYLQMDVSQTCLKFLILSLLAATRSSRTSYLGNVLFLLFVQRVSRAAILLVRQVDQIRCILYSVYQFVEISFPHNEKKLNNQSYFLSCNSSSIRCWSVGWSVGQSVSEC